MRLPLHHRERLECSGQRPTGVELKFPVVRYDELLRLNIKPVDEFAGSCCVTQMVFVNNTLSNWPVAVTSNVSSPAGTLRQIGF